MKAPRANDTELQALRNQEYRESAHAVRGRGFTIAFAFTVALLAFAPSLLGLGSFADRRLVTSIFLGMLAIHLVLVALERRATDLYVLVDAIETVFHVAAYGFLIVSAGHALAIPWFFLSINAQVVPPHPWPWVHRSSYVLMPLVVAFIFERMGQRHDALVSLVLGAALLMILRVTTVAFSERVRSRAQIADLERSLERSRLARELHDGIGADLTAVILSARTAATRASGVEREALLGLANRTRSTLAELRSIVWAVRDPAISLSKLTEQLRTRSIELVPTPIHCSVVTKVDGDPLVESDLAVLILRVVQESVNNAARHSQADSVEIRLYWDERILIEIGDDGTFVANDAPGYGLINLRHRVEQAGGTFELDANSTGTVVRAYLPLSSRPNETSGTPDGRQARRRTA